MRSASIASFYGCHLVQPLRIRATCPRLPSRRCALLSLQALALQNVMSARKNLEEALKGAPAAIKGHWDSIDEFHVWGLTPGTVAEMKSTKGKLIIGLLIMQRVRVGGKEGPRDRYFCKPMDGQRPSKTMQGASDIEENERNRPCIEDKMRDSRSSRRAP